MLTSPTRRLLAITYRKMISTTAPPVPFTGAYIDNDACGIDCYKWLSDVVLARKGREISYHGICDEPQRGYGVAEDSGAG
jgi:hypothetical protein